MPSGPGQPRVDTESAPQGAPNWALQAMRGRELSPGEAALEFLRDYGRERPEVVAMWAFGLGFLLAWKLKPW